jgi:hypothetical protein
VIPQAAVLDCDPTLVGDALSVHLAQQSNSAAVWTLHVWVLIAQGWYHLGSGNTVSPAAGSEPSRTVLVATCPGATGWRVECECTTDDEIANIALQSSKCCPSSIGVTFLTPAGSAPGENVAITSSITLPVQDVPWSDTFSVALANSFVVKAAPGVIRSATLRLDGTAPTATYYVQVWNLPAPPADGLIVTAGNSLAAPVKVVHVLGTDDSVRYDFNEGGEPFTVGASLNLSSTEFTKTSVAGAFLSVINAEFR